MFEKMDDQDDIHTAYTKLFKVSKKQEKLFRLATRKLNEVELEHEELSTKVDEANHLHNWRKYLCEVNALLLLEAFNN